MPVTNYKESSEASGSVRVDLVGGTLDLEPINLILPNVVTMNVATSLKANVILNKTNLEEIIIISKDYNKSYSFHKNDFTPEKLFQSNHFKEMTFICQILDLFGVHSHVEVELSSGAPAGSGLGGSSAMGVTLYKALCDFTGTKLDVKEAVLKVKGCEGRILNQGVPGYQDYFPALVGGILSLKGIPGDILCEQLYTDELKTYLEDHITLVYSGISRDSGINNWDVYKNFFDKKETIRNSMNEIAQISFDAYLALKNKEYSRLVELIGLEGQSREKLAPGITPYEVKELFVILMHEVNNVGIKMCGAGGGGCFILTHKKDDRELIEKIVGESKMQILDFSIESPLES
jgi:D-glycero-alpha-D-manno-heptose-7-phosphate kinase